MKTFGTTIKILIAVGLAIALEGCDGSLSITPEGGVKNASVREIIRGMAQDVEKRYDDSDAVKVKRDTLETISKPIVKDLSEGFIDCLKSNSNYTNVAISGNRTTPIDDDGNALDGIFVDFDIKGGFHAKLQFAVIEHQIVGPLRLNRLPIFLVATLVKDNKPFNISSVTEKNVTLVSIISKEQDYFTALVNTAWSRAQATNTPPSSGNAVDGLSSPSNSPTNPAALDATDSAQNVDKASIAEHPKNSKLSPAAESAIKDGFVEIKDPKVQACTDALIQKIRAQSGHDAVIDYATYNDAAITCGFNI